VEVRVVIGDDGIGGGGGLQFVGVSDAAGNGR
jgi:hypothetical protein